MPSKSDTDRKYSRSLSDYPPPSYLCWLVSKRCNLHCSPCISASGPAVSTKDDLSTEECFRVIDKLAASGTTQLDLTGGEPLLRDDIVEITQHAHDRGLDVMITTNGTVCREKYAALESYDVHFRLSVDGVKPIHERVRGTGTFDEVVQAIHRLQRLDASFTVNSVVHGLNYDTIEDFLSFLEREGVEDVCFMSFSPIGRGEANKDRYSLSDKERAQAKHVIRDECSVRGIDVEIDDSEGVKFLLLLPDGTIVEQVKSGISTPIGDILEDEFATTDMADSH